jgi:hypothetical protein
VINDNVDDLWTALPPEPQLEIAKAFWDEFAPGQPIRLRFLRGRGEAMEAEFPTVEQAWPAVVENQRSGWNVYYFPNDAHNDRNVGPFATDLGVSQARAFFADFDKGIPATFHVEPNIIVRTSTTPEGIDRGQALWVVNYPKRGPVDQSDRGYSRGFRDRQRQLLQAYSDADPACVNISRVLRLPGSLHAKDPSNPQLVTFKVLHRDPPSKTGWYLAGRRSVSDILGDLPVIEKAEAKGGSGEPVSIERLRTALSKIPPEIEDTPPGTNRAHWRNIIFAIRSTTLIASDAIPDWAPDQGPIDEEAELLNLALQWSRGELDYKGRYPEPPPSYYGKDGNCGDEEIEKLFNGADPDRKDGVGFGTIDHLARQFEEKDNRVHPDWPPKDVIREGNFTVLWPDQYEAAPPLEYWDDEKTLPKVIGGAVGMLFAQSSNHKTNIALSLSMKVLKERDAVIAYASGEGSYDVGKLRMPAHGQQNEIELKDLRGRFAMIPSVPRLGDPTSVDEFIRLLKKLPRRPDIIWIDTLNTATAGSNINENDAAFGGLLTENGPVGRISRAFGALVIVVHHKGKNEKAGARGSSAIDGAVDVALEVIYNESLNLLQLFVDKMRMGRQHFSSYWQISYENEHEVPVPVQITRDEFHRIGGKETSAVVNDKKAAENQAKGLRLRINALIQKYGWSTWSRGFDDNYVAGLLVRLDHADLYPNGEPDKSDKEKHRGWKTAIRKMQRSLFNTHGSEDKTIKEATYSGSWQIDDNEKSTWHWHDNLNYPLGSIDR